MTDEPIRKYVKPAHDGARIPDPAHPGLFLPAEGAAVIWDHHWIERERRGEVVVTEGPECGAARCGEVLPATTPATEPDERGAGVPFMITNLMREQLRQRGRTDEQIAQMTPEAAHAELARPAPQND